MVLSELIAAVRAKYPDLPAQAVEAVVRRLFDEMAEVLAEGGRVELRGFGVFSVRRHEPSAVRDPRTSQVIGERASRRVHFKPSKIITQALNRKGDDASTS